MVKFSPAVRLAPVQSLWCPQNEFVFQSDASTTTGFKLTDANGEPITQVVRMSGMHVNEIFNTLTVYAKQRDDQLRRFEFVETLRPTIFRIDVQIDTQPHATSNFSPELLYRFFKENTLSDMTYEAWLSNCIVMLSPQQLGMGADYGENIAKVTTIDLVVHMRESPIGKRLRENYEGIEYTGSGSHAESVSSPYFVLRASFDYENRGLLMNARMEVVRKRNARAYKGLTGLVKDERGLPYQRGIKPA